jgi:hypothetical protein
MAKGQRTKVQIMVDIALQRRPKISTSTTTETFEDPKMVSKTRKLAKGKQYSIQANRDNDPQLYT